MVADEERVLHFFLCVLQAEAMLSDSYSYAKQMAYVW